MGAGHGLTTFERVGVWAAALPQLVLNFDFEINFYVRSLE